MPQGKTPISEQSSDHKVTGSERWAWTVPKKRVQHFKLSTSRYTNLEETPFFALQSKKVQVKKTDETHRQFRIIILPSTSPGGKHFYELAYHSDFEELKRKEWAAVKSLKIPVMESRESQHKWIVSYFTQLALRSGDQLHDDDSDSAEAVHSEHEGLLPHDIDEMADRRDADLSKDGERSPTIRAASPAAPIKSIFADDTTLRRRVASDVKSVSIPPVAKSAGSLATSQPSSLSSPELKGRERDRVPDAENEAPEEQRKVIKPVPFVKSPSKVSDVQRQAAAAATAAVGGGLGETFWPLTGKCTFLGVSLLIVVFPVMLRDVSDLTFSLALFVAVVLAFFLIVLEDPLTVSIVFTPKGHPKLTARPPVDHFLVPATPIKAAPNESRQEPTGLEPCSPKELEARDADPCPTASPALASPASPQSSATTPTIPVPPGFKLPAFSTGIVVSPDLHCMDKNTMTASEYDFQVRMPPNYKKNKSKGSSAPPYFDLIGADMFASDKKVMDIVEYFSLPPVPEAEQKLSDERKAALGDAFVPALHGTGPCGPVPAWVIMHFMFPAYGAGSYFNPAVGDGKGWSWTVYYRLNAYGREQLLKQETNAAKLAFQWWDSDEKSINDKLKCIPIIQNVSELGLGSATSLVISRFNGQPFMTAPPHSFVRTSEYKLCMIDAHNFCYTARSNFPALLPVLSKMVGDIAFVIEGVGDDEQPENIFARSRMSRIGLIESLTYAEYVQIYLRKQEKLAMEKAQTHAATPLGHR